MNTPCRGCEERRIGCHGGCERYLDWRGIRDQDIEQRIMRSGAEQYRNDEMHRSNKAKNLKKGFTMGQR